MARPVRMEDLEGEPDGRRYAPSAGRNKEAVVEHLRRVLAPRGLVLEVAAGTGEHAVAACRAMPSWTWQPTDRDPEALSSQAAWRAHAGLDNLLAPLHVDLELGPWPEHAAPRRCTAVVAINVLHIAPWSTARALIACAGDCLAPGGRLALYGAFFQSGREVAPSNLDFDRALREQDPALGVRRIEDLEHEAAHHGLELARVDDVVNNNLMVVFERR